MSYKLVIVLIGFFHEQIYNGFDGAIGSIVTEKPEVKLPWKAINNALTNL